MNSHDFLGRRALPFGQKPCPIQRHGRAFRSGYSVMKINFETVDSTAIVYIAMHEIVEIPSNRGRFTCLFLILYTI